MLGTFKTPVKRVDVIGGGISGLLVAYRLSTKGIPVRLLETASRLGGLIQSVKTPYGIAESAIQSLLISKPVRVLLKELGTQTEEARSYERWIYRDLKARRFPLNALETFETLYGFLKSRFQLKKSESLSLEEFGKNISLSFHDYLLEPQYLGIYGCKSDQLDCEAVFSKTNFFKRKTIGKPISGMESLILKLKEKLSSSPLVELQLGVSKLNGWEERSQNSIFTAPPYQIASFFQDRYPELANDLNKVSFASLTSVTSFYKKESFEKVPSGLGILFPPVEKKDLYGILFTSSSFPSQVFRDDIVSLTSILPLESEPLALLKIEQTLKELFGLKGSALQHCYFHWEKAIPIYNHHLKQFWSKLQTLQEGCLFFGNWTGSVSVRGLIEESLKI